MNQVKIDEVRMWDWWRLIEHVKNENNAEAAAGFDNELNAILSYAVEMLFYVIIDGLLRSQNENENRCFYKKCILIRVLKNDLVWLIWKMGQSEVRWKEAGFIL